MNKFILATTSVAVLSLLVSCSSSKDDEPMAMPPEPPPTLSVPAGLAASEASPVYATTEEDTLATLMRSASNVFAPIASTLDRTTSGEQVGTELGDDFHIKTIASDGSGGLNATFVRDGEERQVHFGSDDFEAEGCGDNTWCAQDEAGKSYWLWKHYDELEYADAYGSSWGDRLYFVFGARTESDNIPSGSASWFGRMWIQSYKQDSPSHDERIILDGRIILTADFEEGDISGRIQALRSRGDDGTYRALEDSSSHFNVSDGEILNGQFVASLTGMGDASVSGDGTVRGYEGNLLGEFYGPQAQEMGGVVSGSSDAHGRVFGGYIYSEMLNTTSGENAPVISQTTFVDRPGSSVSSTEVAGITNVQRDGNGGYHLTQEINGIASSIHLAVTDLGSNAAFPTYYNKRVGDREYYLWDVSDSFYADAEFDYTNLAGWAITNYPAGSNNFGESTSYSGYMAYGTMTDVDSLPVGTASYNGRAFAQILPVDDPRGRSRYSLRGDLSLTANFAADTIGGSISGIEVRNPGGSDYATTSRVFDIGNGSISGNGFSGDLTEVGNTSTAVNMKGAFYGPSGEEVGGVLSGMMEEGVVRGYFGGSR